MAWRPFCRLSIFGLSISAALAATVPVDVETGAVKPEAAPAGRFLELAQAGGGDGAFVPPVKRERPGTAVPAAQKPAAETQTDQKPAAPAPAAQDQPAVEERTAGERAAEPQPRVGGILAPIQEWLARANREYQGRIVKELSRPSPDDVAAEEAKRKAEQQAAEAARQAEARAKAEAEAAKKAAAEQQAKAAREAEAARRAAAEKADAEAKKQAAEKAAAEAAKLKEADQLAEARRKAAAEEQRLAEEKRRAAAAEAAAKRKEEEQRAAEAAAKEKSARAEKEAAREAESEAERAEPDRRQRHRRWTVTLSTEPIDRPEPRIAPDVRYESEAAVLVASRRLKPNMRLGGAPRGKYKRWVRRGGYCRLAGRKIRLPGRYTVAHGDTLWDISERHYRNGRHYRRIWRANRDKIDDPDDIYPCQKFWLPRNRRR